MKVLENQARLPVVKLHGERVKTDLITKMLAELGGEAGALRGGERQR